MHKLVSSMICHAKVLFKIPKGLIEEIDAAETIVEKEELPVTHTFCQQMDQTAHKQTVKQTTSEALVQLYNHVIDLPDGPIKQEFLQRFQKMHPGTPPFIPRSKRTYADQMDVSNPLKSMECPSPLIRTTLSPISARNTATSTPTFVKRVAFDVVDTSDSFSCETPQYKATPFLSRLTLRTPSGVILPEESPQTNRKRTMQTLSRPGDLFSAKKQFKSCSVHTSENTPLTPSGFMSGTLDISCDESISSTSTSTQPQLKFSTVDHSMEEF